MAVSWSDAWAQAGAGTIQTTSVNSRIMAYQKAQTVGPANQWHWTDTGDSSGNPLTTGFPCILPMMEDREESGAWSQIGAYGPIYDPDKGPGGGDLFFVRTEWTVPPLGWRTTLYSGGADSNDDGRTDGFGRRFFAYMVSGT